MQMLGSQCLLMPPDVLSFAVQGGMAKRLSVTGCAPLLTQISFLKFQLGSHRKIFWKKPKKTQKNQPKTKRTF